MTGSMPTTAMLLQETAQGLQQTLSASPLAALATVFGAGVLTSLNPCIYPMIPITASVISGTAGSERSRGRILVLTIAYVLGLATLYAALGLLAGLSGSIFGAVSASPWALLAVGNLLLLFALVMLDVLPIPLPRKLIDRAAGLGGGGSVGAVFLMGAGSGIVAAPCGAPAFAAVLTWVAATRAGVMGFVYLLAFSLGMSALLVGVGLSSGLLAGLPRSGPWMLRVKRLSALILLVMAEYYFVKAGYGM